MAQTVTQRGHLELIDVNELPPDRGVRELIAYALRLKASDLFFLTNEQHVAVHVRYLGIIEPLSILERDKGHRYMAHIRAETGMDLSEHKRPQDSRWVYQPDDDGEPIDLRIGVVPTLHGEDMAIRLLVRDTSLLSLEKLGMMPAQEEAYRGMLDRSGGLIVMTGPTGSGKTVSMYAALNYLNDGHRKIHTIEDPVEYAVDGLRQSQVHTSIELGPAELLRGVLRQSPDVIMVGEVRDAQTADAAVWAANSGVTVLTTIHAPNGEGAIQSLRGFGVQTAFISTSLRGTINARLVRTLCPDCREAVADGNGRQAFEEIGRHLDPAQPITPFSARGCEKCHNTGYAGRIGAFEVMPISETVRDMVLKGKSSKQIREKQIEDGMLTVRQAALLRAAQGITTVEEVKRTIPPDLTRSMPIRKTIGSAASFTATENRLTQSTAGML